VNENAAGAERHVVAGVEAVPERTEDKDRHGAVTSLVDDVPQPRGRRLVPVVEQLFETRAKLRRHKYNMVIFAY